LKVRLKKLVFYLSSISDTTFTTTTTTSTYISFSSLTILTVTNTCLASSLPVQWNRTGITVAGITGSSSSASNHLSYPYDLAVDSSKTMYIAERDNNRVQMWLAGASSGSTVAGQSSGTAGSTVNYFNRADGVVVDSNGNLYVTDPYNHRVQYWPSGSSTGTIIAGTGI